MSLQLEKGKPRTLAYAPELRHDLKLLEVSEDLLEELQIRGCVTSTFKEEPDLVSILATRKESMHEKRG